MSDIIEVSDASMMFHLSSEKVDSFKEYAILKLQNKLKYRQFWALRNISFSVSRGERIGIVGLNGSGKSTLLKLIAGVLKPTSGSVAAHGTIAPLIELGAGFDINLSARENVYLNGAILGHSNKKMGSYYKQIIEFAELQEFQDVAIKNFSSGMTARLGFSIATCEMPDILILDEILSVGDFAFQQKCLARVRNMTEQGTTVLYVSHSVEQVKEMCSRAIWLINGAMKDIGDSNTICNAYINQFD